MGFALALALGRAAAPTALIVILLGVPRSAELAAGPLCSSELAARPPRAAGPALAPQASASSDSARPVAPQQAAAPEPTIASRYLYRLGDSQDPAGTFHTPTDLAVGGDGSLYVYDESNARVHRLSPSGDTLAVWGRQGSGDGMFGSSRAQAGVAVGPDGSVYVADGRHYRVQRFDAMGRFLGSWGDRGDGAGQFGSTQLGLAVGPDGTVYVADPEGSCIHRFTASGGIIDTWQGAPLRRLQKPDQIAVSPDGARLYVLDAVERESAQLLLYTPDGTWVDDWTSGDPPTVELHTAWALTVAPDGEVYVVDIDWRNEATESRIQRLSADGARLASWTAPAATLADGSSLPTFRDSAVSADGTVYIANPAGGVRLYDKEGSPRGVWGARTGLDVGRLAAARGMAVNEDGAVFVIDSQSEHHVCRYDADGRFAGRWTLVPAGYPYQFPQRLAIAADGSLWATVLCSECRQVKHMSPDGTLLGEFGPVGTEDGELSRPGAIAAAADGSIYVAEPDMARIQHLDASGAFVARWGECHMQYGSHGEPTGCRREDGDFSQPSGIALTKAGEVMVADAVHDRLQIFTPEGEFLAKWGESGAEPGELRAPVGLALGRDDSVLYVADSGNARVQAFTPEGAFLRRISIPDVGSGRMVKPSDVAVDTAGRLHVMEQWGLVYVLGPKPASGWRTQLFDNRWLAGTPIIITESPYVDLDWGMSPPAAGLPPDGFSARFERTLPLPVDRYTFAVDADGGAKLWIDGRIVVDDWYAGETSLQRDVALGSGDHRLILEYNDPEGDAAVHLSWEALDHYERVYLPEVQRP